MRRALTFACVLTACASGTPPPELERFDPAVTPGPNDFPDVPGVVLLDRGTLYLTADATTRNPIAKLRRLRRLKILRDTGAELSRVIVPYDPATVLSDLTVRAVLPNGDEIGVDPANYVETPHETGRRAKAVKVPATEPGTIIEYTYDLYFSDPRFLPPWVFQCPLPTVRSEYAVVVPRGFNVDLRYSKDGEFVDKPAERFETDEGTRYFWSESNLAARFPEPGMPSPDLISPRAHVVMIGAKVGNRDYGGFGTWDEVGAWFISRVPEWAKLSPATIAEAQRIAGETSMEEQALKLLAVVARDLAWEPGPQLPLWQTRIVHPDIVLKEKRGNAVTRGLLLVSLLRAIGIPAIPALATYRDRGVLLPDVPTVYELDLVVAVIPRNESLLVLDPTQLTVSTDVAAPRIQGTRIVALREDGAEVLLVPISQATDSKTNVAYDLKLDERGDLYGTLEAQLTGAEAGALRGLLYGAEPGAYADLVSDFMKDRGAGLPIESASITDLGELRRPLGVKGTVSVKKAVSGEGTSVTMKLGRIVGSTDGETRLREVRRTPMKIGAPRSVEVIATVVLPEDYETEQLAFQCAEAVPAAAPVEAPVPAPAPEPQKGKKKKKGKKTAVPPPPPVAAEPPPSPPPCSRSLFKESWAGGELEIMLRTESSRRIGIARKSVLSVLEVPAQQYAEYRRYREAVQSAEQQLIAIRRPPARSLEY